MKPIVVTPTFNEKDNVTDLIEGVLSVDPNMHIVIVDDFSPDGTAEQVQQYCEKDSRVHLIEHSPRGGRGYADRVGISYALKNGFDVIIQMDADLSHQPQYLPAMLEKIKTSDVVIGSRLILGGGIEGRGGYRNVVTHAANAYIRWVLGLKTRDCTSGFRVYRRNVLEKIRIHEMFSPGPSLLEETLYAIHCAGFTVAEIPITFVDRTRGQSKLTFFELVYISWLVLKIRWNHRR